MYLDMKNKFNIFTFQKHKRNKTQTQTMLCQSKKKDID